MKHLLLLVFISILFFNNTQVLGQIAVLDYNSHTSTQYINDSVLGTDSIYIIYTPKSDGFEIEATLHATYNNEDSLNFNWYFFNATSKQFDLIQSNDTVESSEYLNAAEGGYKVHIENSNKGIDTSFVAWLFIESFQIKEVRILTSACDKMILNADTAFEKTFVYYDLVDFTPLELVNTFTGKWIVEPTLNGSDLTSLRPTFDPPVEPTSFTFEATDKFNYKQTMKLTVDEELTDKDGYPYLRAVKPNFKGVSGQETEPRDTSVKVEAPYGVSFINDSKNGLNYEWHFYNHPHWMSSEVDSLVGYSDLFQPIDSIYYLHPAPLNDLVLGYDVKLFSYGPIYNESDAQCLDTIRKINFVLVDSTEFPSSKEMLPNVFNPNSDKKKNKTLFFLDDKMPVSVRYFSIKIYNRWGNKVYEYEDNDGSWYEDGHNGWDGNTRFGGKARPGVYYYVIFATGWDDRTFEVPGFVHIFDSK